MAIYLNEPSAGVCAAVLEEDDRILISAGTLAEALIVSGRRNVGRDFAALVEGLGMEVVSVTPATARRVGEAYGRWGKGLHPAGLNFGDCFSYVLAIEHDCPLLFVGRDFSQTDVQAAF